MRNLARLPAPAHKVDFARDLDPPPSEVNSLITSIIAFSNTLPGLSFKIFGALTDNIIKFSDIEIISALLNAVRDISSEEKNIMFRISLRSDVYFFVRTSDESTDKISGNVIWLSWLLLEAEAELRPWRYPRPHA